MSIYKDNVTGKWRVVYRYTDWTGETHQPSERGRTDFHNFQILSPPRDGQRSESFWGKENPGA